MQSRDSNKPNNIALMLWVSLNVNVFELMIFVFFKRAFLSLPKQFPNRGCSVVHTFLHLEYKDVLCNHLYSVQKWKNTEQKTPYSCNFYTAFELWTSYIRNKLLVNFYATREVKKRINKVFKTVHPKIQDGIFCVGSECSFAIKRFVRVYIFVKDENQVLDAWGNSFNVGYGFQKYFLKQIIWNLICSNFSSTSVEFSHSYYDPAYS